MFEALAIWPWLAPCLAAVVGLFIGSFLNVVILRLPPRLDWEWRQEAREALELDPAQEAPPPGFVISRSRCPTCQTPIAPWDNLPVLSFVLLRGRCRQCKTSISWQYPSVEAITAIVFALVVASLGVTDLALASLIFSSILIALAGIDLRTMLLPDRLTLALLWLGLLASVAGLSPVTPTDAILGAAAGYAVLWMVFHVFRLLTGKEGMGFGDFKLLAALGAWMGWQMLPMVLLFSALAGIVLGTLWQAIRGTRGQPIPFGPFLAIAGWIAYLWGPALLSIYLGWSGLDTP